MKILTHFWRTRADSNLVPFSNSNTISGNISGDNPIIINTKSADRSGHITPTFSPNSRSLRKQKVNRSSSVVSSPNPKNSNSPQSDFKKRKPSQKRKLKVNLKRNDSSSSQQPITRFLEKKQIDQHRRSNGLSNEISTRN